MDATTQINAFQEFFEQQYKAELHEKVRIGKKYLEIDFNQLAKFDPDLSELLIEQPEEVVKAAEIAIEQFDLPGKIKNFKVRIKKLPKSQKLLVANIRSDNIGKFYAFEGVVRQKSDVRPQVTTAKFECPSCGNILSVLQLDKQFKEPTRCGCGRKGKFRMLAKELIDAQGLKLEEAPENLDGGEQPKRISVLLKNDLVSPMSEKKTSPGTKILINGTLKEVPIVMRTGAQSTSFDLIIEANYVESIAEEFGDIKISKAEEEQIKVISKDAILFDKMRKAVAPSIYGHELIKDALILQLFGGVRKVRDDGVVTRGDTHMLLIGDPGSGKSQMIKRMMKVHPKARYVSGKGASGAGLTAAVVKDEFLSGYSLEAGALVLSNKGMCCIDELDKMGHEDRSAMHEALEQQTVSISKANIQTTLQCQTTVIAAANPKFGRFDPYATIAEQINLPPSLINRFDLIFPIKDLPDEKKDSQLAGFILRLHQDQNVKEEEISTVMLRKYVAYAKTHIIPKLSDEAIDELQKYYLKMRASGSGEGATKSIPISARQLEGMVRLSESAAKVRLSSVVSRDDAKRAIDLLHNCLKLIAFDEESGSIDIDRIASDTPSSQRNKIINVKEIITELEEKIGKTIPLDDIIELAKERKIEEDQVEEVIEKLKRSGDIFEPKRGFIQKI